MNRYPGPRSFTGDDRHLFFGRGLEKQELFRLIVLNNLVVLFGESGTGKTSLLQAGVCPTLEKRQYKPVFIRLNNTSEAPEMQVCRQLKEGGFIPADMPEDRTLWEYFSRFWYVDLGEAFTPVFVFDQFEELFTLYKPVERKKFIKQFADITNHRPPPGLPPEAFAPPQAKFIFSIRSDFLYLLDELSADIPSILRCRFQLRLLGREQAADAITHPAGVEGDYVSKKFSYSPTALNGILEALGRHETEGRLAADHLRATLEIAAFQLQLVCRQLEAKIMQEEKPEGFTIEPDFYGGRVGIRNIIDEFYNTVIEKVPAVEREAAERLLARGLIRNGRRIMMEESAMWEEYGISPAVLAQLHEERLLKREARKRELYYEISHDTLVKPVLKRFKKIEEAERERKVREEEERLQGEREKIRRARLRSIIIGIAALALLGFAFWQLNRTVQAEKEVAEKTMILVNNILEKADEDIYGIRYEDALKKARNAMSFGLKKPSIVKIFIEAAFWYGESGQVQRAADILDSAVQLVNNTAVPELLQALPQDTATAREKIREAIKLLDKVAFDTLWKHYYPVMVEVKGGDFQIGSEEDYSEKPHPASVSNFYLAKYETTWRQYALFCQATGRQYESPGWGTDGDNPVVNVNWYDAVEYANWLSGRMGYEEAVTNDGGNYSVNLKSNGFRLPTEAEWEYAARGGSEKSSYTYAGSNDVSEVAWYYNNSENRTQSIGKKEPNALGIHDMSGNVWEWCWDWYGGYLDNSPLDYKGPPDGSERVLRGGSCYSIPDRVRCADRHVYAPSFRGSYYGFRLARTDGQ